MIAVRWFRVTLADASITYDQDLRGENAVVKAGRKSLIIPAELLRKFADAQIDGNGKYSLGYAVGPKYHGVDEYDVPVPAEILEKERREASSRTRRKQ